MEEKRVKIEKAIEKMQLVANGKSIGDVFWGMNGQEKQEMFSMAVDAMGKQLIPRKLIKQTDCNPKYYSCPNCGRVFWEKYFAGDFCDSCGQALEVTEDGATKNNPS